VSACVGVMHPCETPPARPGSNETEWAESPLSVRGWISSPSARRPTIVAALARPARQSATACAVSESAETGPAVDPVRRVARCLVALVARRRTTAAWPRLLAAGPAWERSYPAGRVRRRAARGCSGLGRPRAAGSAVGLGQPERLGARGARAQQQVEAELKRVLAAARVAVGRQAEGEAARTRAPAVCWTSRPWLPSSEQTLTCSSAPAARSSCSGFQPSWRILAVRSGCASRSPYPRSPRRGAAARNDSSMLANGHSSSSQRARRGPCAISSRFPAGSPRRAHAPCEEETSNTAAAAPSSQEVASDAFERGARNSSISR
jgi:hypothetical protein